MSRHPTGVTVDIYGLLESNSGRSCEAHATCGCVVGVDTVLRLRTVQIINDEGREKGVITAYWVTDGVDRCRVGFLPRHSICHALDFDGRLVQVVDMFDNAESPAKRRCSHRNRGVCQAALIDFKKNSTQFLKKDM